MTNAHTLDMDVWRSLDDATCNAIYVATYATYVPVLVAIWATLVAEDVVNAAINATAERF